jgi:gamma-tubulin complex component 4
MLLPPRTTAEHDINLVFSNAAAKMGAEEEKHFSRLKLRFEGPQVVTGGLGSWGHLYMDYKLDWPLNLFLSSELLDRYNAVFRVLLGLRRAQWEVQHSRNSVKPSPLPVMLLRRNLGILLDSVYTYLQTSITIAYRDMVASMEGGGDFEVAVKAHDQFLSTIHTQCFLSVPTLVRCLDQLAQLGLRFASAVAQSPTLGTLADDMGGETGKIYNLMLTLLSGIKGHKQSSPVLPQLIIMLNYNRYFNQRDQ